MHGRVLVSFAQSSEGGKDTSILQRGIEPTRLKVNRGGEFLRGEEIPTIDFFPGGDYLAIRFSLEPR